MLTGDLVRVRATRDGLKVGLIDPTQPRMLERAAAILAAFRASVGRDRAALDEALAEVEGDGIDHKLTRGLAKICLDRAEFDTSSPIPPVELRRAVFGLAARIGPVRPPAPAVDAGEAAAAEPVTAASLFARLGSELGVESSALARGLYADLPSEQILAALDIPGEDPAWLLHRYNTALVQAALLRARSLHLALPGPRAGEARALFRALKFHQLIAEVVADPTLDVDGRAGYRVTIDGPESLLTQSTRYGGALAKFFPALLLLGTPWQATAAVVWSQRAVALELSDTLGLRSHYRASGTWISREAQWFHARWQETVPDWTIEEGGAPLDQGGEGTVVPDYTLRRGDDVVHVEILGYWRKATLARRLQLMRRHGPRNLILAASRRLMQDAAPDTLPEGIVLFAEVIPVREVLRVAEALCAAPAPRRRTRR